MSITSNDKNVGTVGIDQLEIANYIHHLMAACYGICNKLDLDAGVSGSNFTAALENVFSSGGILAGDLTTFSTLAQLIPNHS